MSDGDMMRDSDGSMGPDEEQRLVDVRRSHSHPTAE